MTEQLTAETTAQLTAEAVAVFIGVDVGRQSDTAWPWIAQAGACMTRPCPTMRGSCAR